MAEHGSDAPSHPTDEGIPSEALPVGGIEWPPDIGGGLPDHGLSGLDPGTTGVDARPRSEDNIATWEDAGGPVFRDDRFGRFDRRFTRFAKWMSYLAGAALFVVVLLAFVDVVGSKVFNWPVPDQHDLIGLLNIVLVFLAVFYGQMDRGATAIELIQKHFHRLMKVAIRTLGGFLGFASCELLAWRGAVYLHKLLAEHMVTSGKLHVPLWPFEIAFVVGFGFMGLGFLMTTTRDLINYRLNEDRYAPKTKKSASSAQ
jgi:TRAP-type C4-dicarboxylate transport system permease small subunit